MDDDPLIRRASLAMLAMVFLGAFSSTYSKASAEEVPKIPIQIPTATASPMPTVTPSPTATRTPEPTPTNIPTATLTPVIEITAGYKIDWVIPWLGEINRINEWEDLGHDPILVLAVMAAESGGDHSVVSYAGACGLMQVIPRHYHELSASAICSSPTGNIYMGMYILRWALDFAEEEGLPLNYGVAFYNCSVAGVMSDRCGSQGGLHYADNVLNFWYPLIQIALED